MKKKLIYILIGILIIILLLIGLYFYGLTSVSNKSDLVNFTIARGTSTKEVINNLYEARIIKSKIATAIYVSLHKDLIVQAGTYELDRSESVQEIFKRFDDKI